MKSYTIRKVDGEIPLNGEAGEGPWSQAEMTTIDEYNWYTGNKKKRTEVRVLYNDDAVCVQFLCADDNISAERDELNGDVCLDSAVEFFATVEPDKRPDYFNLESNCCGVMLLGFGPDRADRTPITPAQAERITIETSVPGPPKEESSADDGWWLAARIPFDLISEMAGTKIQPTSGTKWRGNFFRCGGKTDFEWASWTKIDTPDPDYHRPEFFGELTFA